MSDKTPKTVFTLVKKERRHLRPGDILPRWQGTANTEPFAVVVQVQQAQARGYVVVEMKPFDTTSPHSANNTSASGHGRDILDVLQEVR